MSVPKVFKKKKKIIQTVLVKLFKNKHKYSDRI